MHVVYYRAFNEGGRKPARLMHPLDNVCSRTSSSTYILSVALCILIASEASNYRLGGSREHFLGGYSSLQTPDEQNILCEAQNTPSCAYSTI